MKTICILGTRGRLGNMAAKAFDDTGWNVISVTRGKSATGLSDRVEHRSADAMDRQALIKACAGTDFIFNGLNPPYTKWNKLVLPLAQNVIAAAKASGAVHLFPGNVYNFGEQIPPVCNEQTPQVATTAPH